MSQAKSTNASVRATRKASAVTNPMASVVAQATVAPQSAKTITLRASVPTSVKLGAKQFVIKAGSPEHQARMALMAKLVVGTVATAELVKGGLPASHVTYAVRRGWLASV